MSERFSLPGVRANAVLPCDIATPIFGQFQMPEGGDWKLVKYESPGGRFTQLFNLAENPHELLAEHQAAQVAGLLPMPPEAHQKNLADDPRFSSTPMRRRNSVALTAILDEVFATKDLAAWRKILEAAGVKVGKTPSETAKLMRQIMQSK